MTSSAKQSGTAFDTPAHHNHFKYAAPNHWDFCQYWHLLFQRSPLIRLHNVHTHTHTHTHTRGHTHTHTHQDHSLNLSLLVTRACQSPLPCTLMANLFSSRAPHIHILPKLRNHCSLSGLPMATVNSPLPTQVPGQVAK